MVSDTNSRTHRMRHRYYSRGRPPWWPDNEPWPPDRTSRRWGRPPAFLFIRLALAVVIFTVFCLSLASLAFFVAASVIGIVRPVSPGMGALAIPALIFAALGLTIAVRTLRRMTTPLGDIVEAV